MRNFKIGNSEIGRGCKPFIIAEMSGNHNQSLERALELVDAAGAAGADAVKLQTYTADTMTLDIDAGDFVLDGGLWDGRSLYELYQEAHTPWEWHGPIFDRCREHGMVGFSSAFDLSSVDFLETLDVPAYKIASLELIDTELIAKAASTGKPLIMSTGMATMAEIDEAVRTARDNGCEDLVLLRCTSAYPADPADANIASLPVLANAFGCQAGLSDHTMGTHLPVAAVALGATVIEKHFTLRRADGGVDSAFSLEPEELKLLCEHTRDAAAAIGTPRFGSMPAERISKENRRSLYITQDIKAGDKLTEDNLKSIRPGHGLPVKYRKNLIGRTVTKDIKRGTPMSWELL
ncbi:pseudaminic acid synthase [uncultured Nitratireductor sp.]|uniref:pseudaminic acid synthase n=1 Tax=uncultured Nitratireductor sp. TaxID=520953 RepID=UPI0025EDF239|nr:pseudaminic acid synthase [uncultured Nitratireductor sp.]